MQALSNWNEFESMYEWVAEKVLGIKNAVPENHKRHANQHSVLKKHAPAYVILRLKKPRILHAFVPKIQIPACEQGSMKPLSGYITLFSPPPDATRV